MQLQLTVLQWLALLPFMLAAFRVITLGDRMFTSTVTGRAGGETSAQTSLLMGGLAVFALLFSASLGSTGDRLSLAILVLSFGGFMFSHYMLQGFRSRLWQGFVGAAVQEAALYWLTIGIVRTIFSGVGDASGNIELWAAGWIVVVTMSVALILGTYNRMFKR
jgi:hypothetical protein